MLLVALLVLPTMTAAGSAPTIELTGASVPRAKALALDAALLKGWRLADSGRDHAVFETPLDTPASAGPPDARASEPTLLRIHASFEASDDGARARLRAEEVWRAGTPQAWTSDITDSYRRNLERALASLSEQWRAFIGAARTNGTGRDGPNGARDRAAPRPLDPAEPRPLQPSPAPSGTRARSETAPRESPTASPGDVGNPGVAPRFGVWAFEAERLARLHGCGVDERGAVLVSDAGPVESHRVGCDNRAPFKVRCNGHRCWAVR